MIFNHISLVHVYLFNKKENKNKLSVGRLALKDRTIFFEYSPEFLKTNFELSPFKLPRQSGVMTSQEFFFDGLFGVFNDSLPDGWGRLLLDRKLMKLGLNPTSLSALDRLCYVGKSGMGALAYEPEIENESLANTSQDWDELAEEIRVFQEEDDDRFVDELLILNGSSAGARPKILIQQDQENWIIKFRSSGDPKSIGPIEYAYHLMAIESGLNVPKAKLFPAKKGPGYFGVQRFDLVNGQRFHMHTMSGLLHVDYRVPSLDYEQILRATFWLTKDVRESEKQFRVAVFNILSHNRDDHAKNFSFLMNEESVWSVSPSYDLTFSAGPYGEHCSTVMGEGKRPQKNHLLKLAEIAGIKKPKALEIMDEVRAAVSQWEKFADKAGVLLSSQKMIKTALTRIEGDFKSEQPR